MSTFIRATVRAIARPAATVPAAASARASFGTTTARRLAKITIIGHLGDTPELQATSTGRDILRYAVATNHGPQDNRQTSWFRVTSFEAEGPRRDYLSSLPKGSLVAVEADVTMSTYEDSDGKPRTGVNMVQRSIEVLRRGQAAEAGPEQPPAPAAAGRR